MGRRSMARRRRRAGSQGRIVGQERAVECEVAVNARDVAGRRVGRRVRGGEQREKWPEPVALMEVDSFVSSSINADESHAA